MKLALMRAPSMHWWLWGPPREIVFVIVSPLVESSDTSPISQTEEAIWKSGIKMAPLSPLNFMNLHSFVCVNIFYISLHATYQIMFFLGPPSNINCGAVFWNVLQLKWLLWGRSREAWLISAPCFLPLLEPKAELYFTEADWAVDWHGPDHKTKGN